MNIGVIGSQNTLFHVNGINQGAARMNPQIGKTQQAEQDRLVLTPQGKKQSLLSSLMKQKQGIIDRKSELMASNAEHGGSATDIKPQLELMEEQLKNIDEQIAQARAEELEPEKEDSEGKVYDKPKTAEELQNEELSDIIELSMNLDSIDVVASVKSKVDREIKILEREAESGFGNVEKKQDKIAELKSKSNELLKQAGEYIAATNEQASAAREDKTTASSDEAVTAELPEMPKEPGIIERLAAESENEEASSKTY